jgi:hypothetical protein
LILQVPLECGIRFEIGKVENWGGGSAMIYRDTSRDGLLLLHLIAIMCFLATSGFSNGAAAFVATLPPQDDQIILVAEPPPSAASMANNPANATLNALCRAANLPHGALPEERSPTEQALNPEDAKRQLDLIQQLSKTRKSLCSANPAPPRSASNVVVKIVSCCPPPSSGDGVPPVKPCCPMPLAPQSARLTIELFHDLQIK